MNARYFLEVMRGFGFEHTALVLEGTREAVGLSYEGLRSAARRSDLLVNINGIIAAEELLEAAPVRVYIDIDAGLNQLWHSAGFDRRFDGHTRHVTIGQGIGESWSPSPPAESNG